MVFFKICLAITVLVHSFVLANSLRRSARSIPWDRCNQELELLNTGNASIECANLTVPLDYADISKGTIDLDLLRVHAPKGPAKGSVLLNYGGPGEPGRTSLLGSTARASIITGLVHDLIVFDPRGTVNTIPIICYNQTEGTGATQSNSNASDTAIGEIWVGNKNFADACLLRNGTIGPYIGTATAARDLLSVVDALQEDGMLRFYGMSYGSILGATVAAMFPDRMDKIYLDGIANAHQYYHEPDTEWIVDSDKVWLGFFESCAKVGVPACALATDPNKSGAALEAEFYTWLYALKEEPFSTGPTSMLTYTSAKGFLWGHIYQPSSWHNVSLVLDAAYRRNGTLLSELIQALPAPITASVGGNAEQGIKCSEKTVHIDSLAAFRPIVEEMHATSKIFGDQVSPNQAACFQWKMPAIEIYQGDFQVKTKNPILFVSNEFDPVAPLVSARNMTATFDGSALLVNKDGYGHTTSQQQSVCIFQHAADYFLNGKLPEPGTICEPSASLFGNVTSEDVQVEALKTIDPACSLSQGHLTCL